MAKTSGIYDFFTDRLTKGNPELETDKIINDLIHQDGIGNTDSFLYFLNKVLEKQKGKNSTDEDQTMEILQEFLGSTGLDDLRKLLGDRTSRYTQYDAIVRQISYAKRALSVLGSEILSPNVMDSVNPLIIKKNPESHAKHREFNKIKRRVLQIIRDLRIIRLLRWCIKLTCKYGDCFTELIDMEEELKKKEIFTEGVKKGSQSEKVLLNESIKLSTINDSKEIKIKVKKANKEYMTSLLEQEESSVKRKTTRLDNLLVLKHNPGLVLRIGDDVCLGYLIFPKEISRAPIMDLNSIYAVADDSNLKKFLGKLKKAIQADRNIQYEIEFNREIKTMLTRLYLFYTDEGEGKDAEVRFVPPEGIVHFSFASDAFDPYGESIFHDLEFDAKLVVLFKMSMTIMRLTRSMEKRVIALEVGVDRNARNALEKIREHYERRKYSIGDAGGIDSIPSLITTFENIYVPMRDGKKYVEFDTLSPPGDMSQSVEDWKAIRDSFTAGLDIPPAYIGIEENVESRALLSHENIIFARQVIDKQIELEEPLNMLISSIYDRVYGEPCSDHVLVQFHRPRSIELAMEAEYYESVDRFLETIEKLGLSKKKFKEKYIDPDLLELEEEDITEKIDTSEGEEEGGGF